MKKILILIFFIVSAFAVFAVFIILNNSAKSLSTKEKESALTQILGRKPNLSEEQTGDKEYVGKYVSFIYPAKAAVYEYRDPNIKNNISNLEIFSFDIDKPRIVFYLNVSENDQLKSINEISAVIYRQSKSKDYTKSEIVADGQKGFAFEKEGNSPEKTGFFFFNNKIYSISITGSDFRQISLLFENVIRSIDFK